MTGARPRPDERTASASSTGLDPHVAAALAYLAGPFSGILVLLAEQTSAYVRFHAWQSVIGLGGLGIVVVCLMTLAFVSIVVSATAFKVLLYLGWATWAAWIVLWIVCLARAFSGSTSKLPIAGELAARRA
jgi:uncharacterized membrane protein